LIRTDVFADFAAAIRWVNQVAVLAERRNHHPDIDIRWNRVTLKLTTHETGGLTDRDWDWAEAAVLELG
jgi:4a-hydroxytetrahydrobiopterin dehydratase